MQILRYWVILFHGELVKWYSTSRPDTHVGTFEKIKTEGRKVDKVIFNAQESRKKQKDK
jgi:hypothetical protein